MDSKWFLEPKLFTHETDYFSFPDFFANFLASGVGIGTGEIENHRVSMIIPILFIASIYSVGFVKRLFEQVFPKVKNFSFFNDLLYWTP